MQISTGRQLEVAMTAVKVVSASKRVVQATEGLWVAVVETPPRWIEGQTW